MFAGLTAVGKTTHSSILARALGYRVVSATDALLKELQLDPTAKRVWFDRLEDIEDRRDSDSTIDDRVDTALIRKASDESHIVFDTWALPWLSSAPAYRIKILSDELASARKAYVSQGLSRSLDLDGCVDLLEHKNRRSRDRFLSRHSIDLDDESVFDLVLDSSALIPKPTFRCAREGIRALKPLIETLTRATIEPSPDHLQIARRVIDRHLGGIIKNVTAPTF